MFARTARSDTTVRQAIRWSRVWSDGMLLDKSQVISRFSIIPDTQDTYSKEAVYVCVPLGRSGFHVLLGAFKCTPGVPPLVCLAQKCLPHTFQTWNFALDNPWRVDDEHREERELVCKVHPNK